MLVLASFKQYNAVYVNNRSLLNLKFVCGLICPTIVLVILITKKKALKSSQMQIRPYFSDHPDFPQFDDIEDDLNKVENTWGLFDEFHTSMKEMANEEWILFR